MPEISRSERAAYLRQLIFGQDWPSNFSTMNTIVINDNADDWDLIVETDTSTRALVVDGGLNAVQVGTTTAGNLADFRATAIILNEGGLDADFRLETDGNANAVVVDAGLLGGVGQVSIGSAAQATVTTALIANTPALTATASQPYSRLLIASTNAVTIPTGTAAVVAGLRVEEPNITSTGTTTVGATAYFPAAPTEGTNNYTVFSDAGLNRFDGDVVIGGAATAGATLAVADTVVTSGTSATLLVTGAAHTGMDASTEVNFVRFNLGQTVEWAVGALTTERAFRIDRPTIAFVTGSTLTTGVTLDIDGPPTAGTNATITNAIGLRLGGASTQVTASGLVYQSLQIPAHTLTLTGTTQVTSSAIASIGIGQLTITNAGAGTVDNAAGIYIANAPVAAGSAVVTNSYSLWVDAGNSRFDGRVTMAKGADVASGTTLTFGSDGNFFDITGTTTINHITTAGWTIGSIIILQFDGSVTVTHNGASPPAGTVPILLSAAGNLSATAGDTLMLVYEGTTGFREVARTVI